MGNLNSSGSVQNDQVQAEYKDGILNLTLPKVTENRNKVVKLNLAELHQSAAPAALEADRETTTSNS